MRLLPSESLTILPADVQMFYHFSPSSISCPSAPSKSLPSTHMPHTITVPPKQCQMYTSLGTFLLLFLNLTNSLSQMLCYIGLAVIEHQSNTKHKSRKLYIGAQCIQLLDRLNFHNKNGTLWFSKIHRAKFKIFPILLMVQLLIRSHRSQPRFKQR